MSKSLVSPILTMEIIAIDKLVSLLSNKFFDSSTIYHGNYFYWQF